MLIDARNIENETVLEADLCIVGAGAAGITLAREFFGSDVRVALVESGDLELQPETQNLYAGDILGHPYFPLESCRLRYLGGTTNHWGGTCRPLDEMDFQERSWVPHSGWPFPRSHLDPFYERAQPVLQLGPNAYSLSDWQSAQYKPFPLIGDRLITAIFQQSPPTRFGETYRQDLARSGNVKTYLNANVVDIDTIDSARMVTRLRIATLEGNRFWIKGRYFVLAAGGIEVPRILLFSNRVQNTGLGNQNDLVGRYFLEHPILQAGTIGLSDPDTSTSLYEKHSISGTTVKGFLTPSPESQRDLKLLNFGARPNYTSWSKISSGVASYQILRDAYRNKQIPDDFFEHVMNVIADIDDVYASRNKKQGRKKLLSLKYWQESVPNPDSRVTLGHEKDALGKPRANLDWRLTEMDKRSMQAAVDLIGQDFGRAGIGRLQLAYDVDELWSEKIAGSYHHMGTTRMNDDPHKGVVDRNLLVHGISNLYVASSSVFPTTGHANPTLTIVALSLRLSEHIKEKMI